VPIDADLLAGASTAGCAGLLSALGQQFIAEADVASGLMKPLPEALQGRATARVPPGQGVLNRPTLAHVIRR
jgi:hypothetical protein